MFTWGTTHISSMAIVDDESRNRISWQSLVEEMPMEAIVQADPLPHSVDLTIDLLRARAGAVLSDHHLMKQHGYARFSGAEFVARCYDRRFPAILCTRWMDAERDQIRHLRRKIPVIIPPKELTPDALQHGLGVYLDELAGIFLPTREPHRTLLRVEELAPADGEPRTVYVTVHGWDLSEVVEVQLEWLPADVRAEFLAGPRKYLGASANIGAEQIEDLYFCDWEPG